MAIVPDAPPALENVSYHHAEPVASLVANWTQQDYQASGTWLAAAPVRLTATERVQTARYAGLLAFWDMGHAADRMPALDMHHDFGVGSRSLQVFPPSCDSLCSVSYSFVLFTPAAT